MMTEMRAMEDCLLDISNAFNGQFGGLCQDATDLCFDLCKQESLLKGYRDNSNNLSPSSTQTLMMPTPRYPIALTRNTGVH